MDGTLLSGQDDIHPDNLLAIREAMRRGVRFAVASGRSAASCGALLAAHGLPDAHIIACNGGQIMDRPYGTTLALYHLDLSAAEAAARAFAAHGLGCCLYTEDAIVYSTEQMMREQEAWHTKKPGMLGSRVLAGPAAMVKALRTTPMKLFGTFDPGQEAAFASAREACGRIPGVELTSSWEDNFEVMPAGVNKGAALEMLSARLGIAREEIMAFGDNDNDLPMLLWAGIGIAMANARPAVKRAVRRQTGACQDGGVAQGIRAHCGV